jgi:hypothetical protein
MAMLDGQPDPGGRLVLSDALRLIQSHLDVGYRFRINPLPELRTALHGCTWACVPYIPESHQVAGIGASYLWLVQYTGEHEWKEHGLVSARPRARRKNTDEKTPPKLFLPSFGDDSMTEAFLVREAKEAGFEVMFG